MDQKHQAVLRVNPTEDQRGYESALALMIRVGEKLAQQARERERGA